MDPTIIPEKDKTPLRREVASAIRPTLNAMRQAEDAIQQLYYMKLPETTLGEVEHLEDLLKPIRTNITHLINRLDQLDNCNWYIYMLD